MSQSEKSDTPGDITRLLERWQQGDTEAFDSAAAALYPELRRIARAHLGREPAGQTLQPTALVNEAFLRLSEAGRLRSDLRTQFFALAAQVMRRVLVDRARSVHVVTCGGTTTASTPPERIDYGAAAAADFIALHDALDDLSRLSARKARIIELRFFGGMSLEETADVLGLSKSTVHREEHQARAWLTERLSH